MTRERFYFPTKRKFSVLNLAYSIDERQTPTQLKQFSIAAEQIVDVGRRKKQNVFSHVRLVVPCPSEKNFSQQSVFWFVDLFKLIPSESRLRFRCCTLSCSTILRNHPNRSHRARTWRISLLHNYLTEEFICFDVLITMSHASQSLLLSLCFCKDKILGHKTHSSSIDRPVDMLTREKSRAFCDHWLYDGFSSLTSSKHSWRVHRSRARSGHRYQQHEFYACSLEFIASVLVRLMRVCILFCSLDLDLFSIFLTLWLQGWWEWEKLFYRERDGDFHESKQLQQPTRRRWNWAHNFANEINNFFACW